MNIAQLIGDFLYRDFMILQQLACPFHANPRVIPSDRFVEMLPKQAIERYGGHLKIFAKWSDRITLTDILS